MTRKLSNWWRSITAQWLGSKPRPNDKPSGHASTPTLRASPDGLPGATAGLYLILATLVSALIWAGTTQLEEVTRCEARVVPDGSEQVIASLEAGILRELLVREGQQVDKDQELVRLDPTRGQAQENEGQAKRIALVAMVARLKAETNGDELAFPPEVLASASLTASETEVYNSRWRALSGAVSSIDRSLALLQHELGMARRMSNAGLMSVVEVMRLDRQVIDLQQQKTERINRYRQDASAELSRASTELAQLDEQMVVRQDVLRRTRLMSPVRGVVKNIRANTLGGVINAGAAIMEIAPVSASGHLLVEARVRPKDIGFVQVGQAAEIKLTGYDFNIYGGLKGRVEYISPDALGEVDRNGSGELTYYRTLVRTETASLSAGGKTVPVIAGMTATLEIKTGQRSVLSALLRPMLKSREALSER